MLPYRLDIVIPLVLWLVLAARTLGIGLGQKQFMDAGKQLTQSRIGLVTLSFILLLVGVATGVVYGLQVDQGVADYRLPPVFIAYITMALLGLFLNWLGTKHKR